MNNAKPHKGDMIDARKWNYDLDSCEEYGPNLNYGDYAPIDLFRKSLYPFLRQAVILLLLCGVFLGAFAGTARASVYRLSLMGAFNPFCCVLGRGVGGIFVANWGAPRLPKGVSIFKPSVSKKNNNVLACSENLDTRDLVFNLLACAGENCGSGRIGGGTRTLIRFVRTSVGKAFRKVILVRCPPEAENGFGVVRRRESVVSFKKRDCITCNIRNSRVGNFATGAMEDANLQSIISPQLPSFSIARHPKLFDGNASIPRYSYERQRQNGQHRPIIGIMLFLVGIGGGMIGWWFFVFQASLPRFKDFMKGIGCLTLGLVIAVVGVLKCL